MAHIIPVAQAFANDDGDEIAQVWADYRAGKLSRDELITRQDTIMIQRGQVCKKCGVRAMKSIIAGEPLCGVCFKMQTRRAA